MNKLIKKKIHSTELIWQIDLLNMSFWEAPILKTLQVASQLIKSQSQRPMELAPPSVISCLRAFAPVVFSVYRFWAQNISGDQLPRSPMVTISFSNA